MKQENENQHVVPREDGWGVKPANSERASRVFKTKGEAVEYAKGLAKKHKVLLVVHDGAGKFTDFERKPEVKDQHVVRKGMTWAVVEEDGQYVSQFFRRKGAAMAHAYNLAVKHDVCMLVHDKDGKFESHTCPADRKPGILEVVRMKLKV